MINPTTIHRDYYKDIELCNFLKENNIMTKNGRFIVTHFPHNGNNNAPGGCQMMLHEKLEEEYMKAGIEVAYDGMKIITN